jgi:hypothetical protein
LSDLNTRIPPGNCLTQHHDLQPVFSETLFERTCNEKISKLLGNVFEPIKELDAGCCEGSKPSATILGATANIPK